MSLLFSNFIPHTVSLVVFIIVGIMFFSILFSMFFSSTSSCVLLIKFSLAGNLNFSLPVFFDLYSTTFAILVCMIACMVIVFSGYYMGNYTTSLWFITFLSAFVASMLLLILMGDIMFLMLGWDGLGLVSFILILFYETSTCTYSALITLITNRLGDRIFLLLISLILLNSSYSRLDLSLRSILLRADFLRVGYIIILLILVGSITKSAFFPFRRWLPAAMAAPTPISALVHSSTLVTAGLYLFIRFYPLIQTQPYLVTLIILLRLLTSLVAGCSTIAELDLKKLVALSTLSHLGFIGIRIFSGAVRLAFIHLFSHALFKSLLFVSVGGLILVVRHSQDARLLSFSSKVAPFSSSLLVISSLSLIGLPFTRGFYSKDFILESFYFRRISTIFIFFTYTNVALRFFYSFKIIFFNSNFFSHSPFTRSSPLTPSFLLITLFISFLSVCFCPIYISLIGSFSFIFILPSFIKLLPFLIFRLGLGLLLFILLINKTLVLPVNFSGSAVFFISKIFFIASLTLSSAPPVVNSRISVLKSLEIGYLSFLASSSRITLSVFKRLSSRLLLFFIKLPFRTLLFAIILACVCNIY